MKKILLLVIFIASMSGVSAQRNNPWQVLSSDKVITAEKIRETTYSENQKLLQFNAEQFKQTLANVAERGSGQAGVEIQLPNTQGKLESFLIWESSNFAPELQAQFPEIRAYVGKGVTDPTALLNLSFSPQGIQTMVFRADNGSEFIEPFTKDRSVYVVFDSKTRTKSSLPFVCSTEDVAMADGLRQGINNQVQSNDQVYRTMRLALSCTGEYGTYHGGAAGALAAMNATMTRCNGVFERDLAVKLIIIANNNLVVYTNANTDPYSPSSAMNNWNAEVQSTLTSVIGEANYDIGHLFGATGGGGSAGCIGCVCVNNQKGSGITSPADGVPMGDTFDIDYVAHEMGHQMGANHTFTHTAENNAVNVEPGSGSTIMAYAGIGGGGTDMQSNSDDYFTYRSILQIQTNLTGKTCPVSTSIVATNPRPTVSAGSSYSIPVGTAFKLTGTASDTAGQNLTYCWEQNNDATTVGGTATFPSPTKTDGPNWRSRVPSSSPVRFMPPFQNVLSGQLINTWETVSTVARTLTFTLTVRDNVLGGGQTNTGVMAVTVVDGGGAFAITNPSVENVSWTPGSTQTVTWNVAGTTANGINTANVNILFSTDGGATFTPLASNTPNDGSQAITLPSTPAPNCRLMIEAVGNIFYAVSKNIALGYTFTSTCATYTNNNNLNIPDGLGANTPGATVQKTINVPATGTISDVNVTLVGTHTYFWDLIVAMNHPDGTQVALLNRNCNQVTTGFNVLFNDASPAIVCAANLTGTFAPASALSAYNGKPMNGTWTLLANDNYNGDTGSIGNWSIEICSTTATLNTPENTLTDFSIFPNPNNGNFTLQFSKAATSNIEVTVFDMRGRKIFENSYNNEGAFNENIQLSNAQTGIYLVSVTDGVNKIVKRIAVE
jgi:subtilisin-like proprotein convertase family protein